MLISVVNHSNTIPEPEIMQVIRAANRQLQEDFKPHWHIDVVLRLEGRSSDTPDATSPIDMRGDAILYIRDEADVDGALGYHALNHQDIPFGVVFTELSRELGEPWSVTLSHEALELALDPGANSYVRGPHPEDANRSVLHWREACDAVQAQSYEIDHIPVSNFVLPSYFSEGEAFEGRNDFLGQSTGANGLHSFGVAPGGYVGFLDPETGESGTYSAFGDNHARNRQDIKYKAKGARRAMRYMATHEPEVVDQLDALCVEFEKGANGKTMLRKAEDLAARLPGMWTVEPVQFTNTEFDLTPERSQAYTPKESWELAHQLTAEFDVAFAEPMFIEAAPEVEDEARIESGRGNSRLSSSGGKHNKKTERNYDWSLHTVNAPDAWEVLRAAGKGLGRDILVAHPDSGYRDHAEINGALDLAKAWDFIGNDAMPREDDADGNHGLSTGSVIVSRDNRMATRATVTGTAPEATLVPFRVVQKKPILGITPVMFKKAARRLRDAIRRATHEDCHVISISLGTKSNYRSLRKAIEEAVDSGIIILAAGGNSAWPIVGKEVIYPARYDSVIAVAACDIERKPWSRSARGDEIDITAPGQSVWRAVVDKGGNPVVKRSSGTSYAVASVAGLAALWLSRHGREELMDKYKEPGGSHRGLVAAFREVLQASAVPGHETLTPELFGGGIVDAVRLIGAPLPEGTPFMARAIEMKASLDPLADVERKFAELSKEQIQIGIRTLLGTASSRSKTGRSRASATNVGATEQSMAAEFAYMIDTDPKFARAFARVCTSSGIPEQHGAGTRLSSRCEQLGSASFRRQASQIEPAADGLLRAADATAKPGKKARSMAKKG